MKKRTAFVGAILSLIPLGQPLIIKTSLVLSSSSLMLSLTQKVNAESADFYFDRGFEKGENGDYYGAISDYNKALEIDPNDSMAYYNRGWNKGKLKDYYGAISDFNKAIEINPNYANAYFLRGNSKDELEDYYGAIADYTKALTLDPNNLDALYNRGWLRTDNKIKNYDGAISDFIKLTELEPKSVANIIDLATAYSYANKNKEAVKILDKGIALEPENGNVYFWQGIYKILGGNVPSGCKSIRKSRKMKASDYDPSWLRLC